MLRDEQEGWTYRGIGDDDLYKILETYVQHCYASRQEGYGKSDSDCGCKCCNATKTNSFYIGFKLGF